MLPCSQARSCAAQPEVAVFVQGKLGNEGEASGPMAHAALIVLHQSDGLDPVNGTNDRSVTVPDVGWVCHIPDIGLQVRHAAPDAQPEPVVIPAVAQPLHGHCRTLRLNFEADEASVVGADLECRLTDTSRTFVVDEFSVDLNVSPRHGREGRPFDYLGGQMTIPVGTMMELHVSGVRRRREEKEAKGGATGRARN